jgi:hypothetical protein
MRITASSPDFSRRHEMQHNGGGDAGRNRDERAPPPVRKNAKGYYRQDGQQSELEKIQSHRFTANSERRIASPSRLPGNTGTAKVALRRS